MRSRMGGRRQWSFAGQIVVCLCILQWVQAGRGQTDPIAQLIQQLKADQSDPVREDGIRKLALSHDPRVVGALITALADPDVRVRADAAAGLGNLRDPHGLEPLVTALKDPSALVRSTASTELGKWKDPRATVFLLWDLKDASSNVREAAISVLKEMNKTAVDPQIVEALKAALDDTDEQVRENAAEALRNQDVKVDVPPLPALRVTANLVVVNAVVRDQRGHPVHGLKQSDFVLVDNKAVQKLKYFDEHTSAEIELAGEAKPVLPAGTFTNFEPVPEKGSLNILLIDKMNTPKEGQAQLKQAILSYLDEAKPGTRMAIFTLDSSHLKLLQGFTDDRALLRRAVVEEDTPFSSFYEKAMRSQAVDYPGPPCIELPLEIVMKQSMQFMAFYLGNLPGRKNLLWFSEKYPIHLLEAEDPDPNGHPCWVTQGEFYWEAAKLTDKQVSIYPIPVLGKDWLEENSTPKHPEKHTAGDVGELARITGGQAFYGELKESIAEAIEDGADYYTLAYVPADVKLNGGFHNIELKLADGRIGELSYRRGFFANDPQKRVRMSLLGHGQLPNDPHPSAMQLALTLGVPNASEVIFAARVRPVGANTETTLATGDEGSKGLKGPYQRYGLRLAVDLHNVMLTQTADGRRQGSIEMVAFIYDLNGKVVNDSGRTAHLDLSREVYAKAMQDGLPLGMEVSVPVKGTYTFRIAVHDLNNDHVGALEVPVSSISKLDLASTPAPVASK